MNSPFRFKHFQSRLLVFFLVPLTLVLAAVYVAVTRANTRNALVVITGDLELGVKNFADTIDLRDYTLAIAGDALSADYATREAINTDDPATILSAMANLLDRLLLADFIVMVNENDGTIAANTLNPATTGSSPIWFPLIEQARALDLQGEYPGVADVFILDGRPYHLTVIPFYQPDLTAWIGLGFEIDQEFVDEFEESVAGRITLLFQDAAGRWQSNGSTQSAAVLRELVAQFTPPSEPGRSTVLTLAGEEHVTLARPIDGGKARAFVVLQDEIGELAQAFNGMAKGLAEKEKVRNLLGKVVSPEIASELLRGDIELGGEEREVTVLFSDVRGFTTLCEGQAPQQVLALLNEYFSAITAVIEANGGVVDKFIGDAVMALWGAPVAQADAAERAVRTAFGMEQALIGVNAGFAARGLNPIAIGIGINTGKVVAGNMGAPSRLNYTVIGDGVNLASRLEGLTKQYGANIIVSEACARAAPGFSYRELGLVQVKGRQEPVRIFAPLPVAGQP